LITRIRKKGPNGDINRDIDNGPVAILTSHLAAGNSRNLVDAIPPRKEHLKFINQDQAAKWDPKENPEFTGPISGSAGARISAAD